MQLELKDFEHMHLKSAIPEGPSSPQRQLGAGGVRATLPHTEPHERLVPTVTTVGLVGRFTHKRLPPCSRPQPRRFPALTLVCPNGL